MRTSLEDLTYSSSSSAPPGSSTASPWLVVVQSLGGRAGVRRCRSSGIDESVGDRLRPPRLSPRGFAPKAASPFFGLVQSFLGANVASSVSCEHTIVTAHKNGRQSALAIQNVNGCTGVVYRKGSLIILLKKAGRPGNVPGRPIALPHTRSTWY